MEPMQVVLDDDVARFQSSETEILAKKGRKVTKNELLDAFDKKAARVQALEARLTDSDKAIEEQMGFAADAREKELASRRETRLLTQDVRDLEFCVEQLSDLCRHALRYHPTDYTETKLDEEIRGSVETTRVVIDQRHQSYPDAMTMTDTPNEESAEKRIH